MSGGGQDQPPDIKTIATGAVTKFIQALVSNKPLLKQEISPAPIWRLVQPEDISVVSSYSWQRRRPA
jgi:hypothetical protein